MLTETIRFFPKIKPGQEYKQNWSEAYESNFPVNYRNGPMSKGQIHHHDGLIREIFNQEVYDKLQQVSQKESLFCIDLLSAYGDCFLSTIYDMSPEEIFSAWSSEESSLNLPKNRRFKCKTLGMDISGNAIDYGRRAGIFDETLRIDINNLSASEGQQLSDSLCKAHFVHLGSPGYINLDPFYFIIDSFAAGKGFGTLMVTFNYVFVKYHKEFKQYIVKKLDLVNCFGGILRRLIPAEKEYFNVSNAYSTTWVMERKKT